MGRILEVSRGAWSAGGGRGCDDRQPPRRPADACGLGFSVCGPGRVGDPQRGAARSCRRVSAGRARRGSDQEARGQTTPGAARADRQRRRGHPGGRGRGRIRNRSDLPHRGDSKSFWGRVAGRTLSNQNSRIPPQPIRRRRRLMRQLRRRRRFHLPLLPASTPVHGRASGGALAGAVHSPAPDLQRIADGPDSWKHRTAR